MLAATALEEIILRDIQEKTGLSFRLICGIDTRQKPVADAVLPIVQEWPEQIDDSRHRNAIYSRFHTPYAYAYLDKIISWWSEEQDELALAILTQDLALLVKSNDAKRVWDLCRKLPARPCHYWLVSKLAAFPSTAVEAKDALLHALKTSELKPGDLEYIAKVDDSRIREWFQQHLASPDPRLRQIANRATRKVKAWPRSVRYANVMPDQSAEIFSTENNLEDTEQVITKMSRDLGVRIPSVIKGAAFLSSAELDRWIVADISSRTSPPAQLWFRLEDSDTVEIVLTKKTPVNTVESVR